jgi:hypothetical protein
MNLPGVIKCPIQMQPNKHEMPLSKKRNNFTAILSVVLLLPILGIGLLSLQFNRPPFDLVKFQQLHRGMTSQQVRQVLGKPTSTNETSWHYSQPMSWSIVHIHFDRNDLLESHDYDY